MMAKLNYQHTITPIFSVTWAFRNHSNMLILYLRNIYYNQCRKQITFSLVILLFIQKMCDEKEQHLIVIETFCNIKCYFNVTFDQFNASLL